MGYWIMILGFTSAYFMGAWWIESRRAAEALHVLSCSNCLVAYAQELERRFKL